MSLDPETVLNVVQDILVVRYVSVAGLVILLYDHSLSFSDEVKLVWNAKFTSSKFLFLAMRYLVPCMMIVHSVQLSGLSDMHVSDKFCKAWFTMSIFVGRITIVFNNWLVLLRLWILWERDQTLILCTLSLFIAAQMATFICTSIGLARMLPQIYFVPTLHLCVSTAPAKLAVMWIPGLAFESVVLMAMGWKVFQRPQSLTRLHRDGFVYFLFLFALGLTNTILVFVARPSLVFVVPLFMWCFTTTTTCRLILNLRRTSEVPGLHDERGDLRFGDHPLSRAQLEVSHDDSRPSTERTSRHDARG